MIDHCVTHSWDVIQAMDAATFESSVFETFEIALRYDLTLLYIYNLVPSTNSRVAQLLQ